MILVMKSLAGNAENFANPNLPLNPSKADWKSKTRLTLFSYLVSILEGEIPAKDEGDVYPHCHTLIYAL